MTVSEGLGEVELRIEALRHIHHAPISKASIDRCGRKVLAYPVTLDRVGIKAHSTQFFPARSEDDKDSWSLPTREEDLLRRSARRLRDVEQT